MTTIVHMGGLVCRIDDTRGRKCVWSAYVVPASATSEARLQFDFADVASAYYFWGDQGPVLHLAASGFFLADGVAAEARSSLHLVRRERGQI